MNDRIMIPDSDHLKLTGSFSIVTWFYIATLPQNPGKLIFFRGDDIPGGLDPYSLGLIDSKIQFHIESLSSAVYLRAPIPTGQYVHVAATFDSTTGSMKIFINGSIAADTITPVRPYRDLNPLYHPGIGIGNTQYPYFNYPFHGIIDELAIYNRTLSTSEIDFLYHEDGWYPGSISAIVFNDLNKNGIRNTDEPGLSIWKIQLTGSKVATAFTDTNGYYSFDTLFAGTYTVSGEKRWGWIRTLPTMQNDYTINLSMG